jgi:hypothetical protein
MTRFPPLNRRGVVSKGRSGRSFHFEYQMLRFDPFASRMHTAIAEGDFAVSANEKLTAFLERERVTRESFRFVNAE